MRERSETTERLLRRTCRLLSPHRASTSSASSRPSPGLGEVARRLAAALDSAGVPFAAIPYRDTLGRQRHPHGLSLARRGPLRHEPDLPQRGRSREVRRRGGQRTSSSGGTRSESGSGRRTSSAPRTGPRPGSWTSSGSRATTSVRAVAAEVEIPVHVVPVPVEPPRGPFRTRTELGLPDAFTFLFVFDYWSGERKNPAAVVRGVRRGVRGPARARSSSSRASTGPTGGPSSSQRSRRSPTAERTSSCGTGTSRRTIATPTSRPATATSRSTAARAWA